MPFPGAPPMPPMPPIPMPAMRPPMAVPIIPVPVIPPQPPIPPVRPPAVPVPPVSAAQPTVPTSAAPTTPATTEASATPVPAAASAAAAAAADDGPPAAKKARTEDDLESEEAWLSKVTGSITVYVQIPGTSPNPEWKLDGRRLSVTMDIAAPASFQPTFPIGTLKNFVQDETGLPGSKQKLLYDGLFLKDACTLAYYNMNTDAVVQLQIKERGGKKK
ncbi:unnamed protein product [Gongylonema pulchrum]|uniref:Ubiquitin-like domain-containing protein n=1 Tax=Gongylonema pulchrum TaxID=637853 RepID=A0A183EKJ2_9BILA|nr:unnamed protein product [Gongylonema pulchrum]